MSDSSITFFELLSLILAGTAIVLSLLTRRRQETFERESQVKEQQFNDMRDHFPDLIRDFRDEMDKFEHLLTIKTGAHPQFSQIRKRVETGEIEFIHAIDPDLYRDLIKINDKVNPRLREFYEERRRVCEKTIERWTDYLQTFKHGGFGERGFADEIFYLSLGGILDGNPDFIDVFFNKVLDRTVNSSTSYFNNYTDDTPEELKRIANEEFIKLRELLEKITADFQLIHDSINKMLIHMRG